MFSKLKSSSDGKEIADYLLEIETKRMGFPVTKQTQERAQKIADILLEHREQINANERLEEV